MFQRQNRIARWETAKGLRTWDIPDRNVSASSGVVPDRLIIHRQHERIVINVILLRQVKNVCKWTLEKAVLELQALSFFWFRCSPVQLVLQLCGVWMLLSVTLNFDFKLLTQFTCFHCKIHPILFRLGCKTTLWSLFWGRLFTTSADMRTSAFTCRFVHVPPHSAKKKKKCYIAIWAFNLLQQELTLASVPLCQHSMKWTLNFRQKRVTFRLSESPAGIRRCI